jgi:hypothetical protein
MRPACPQSAGVGGLVRQKSVCDNQNHHARENQEGREGVSDHRPGRIAGRRSWLRFRRLRRSHDIALCLWFAGLRFGRRAYASQLAVISAVDLAEGQRRGLGFAHRLEPGSIVGQKVLGVWRKVIETTELGHHEPSGKIRFGLGASFLGDIGAEGHGGPGVSPAKLAGVHGDRWTARLEISIDVAN